MQENQEEIKTPENGTQGQILSVQEQTNGVTAPGKGNLGVGKSSEFNPQRRKEFEIYKIWRRLPTTLRGQKEKTLLLLGFDKVYTPLLQIKTQRDFARKFKVDEDTVSLWNKHIEDNPEKNEERFGWAKDLTKNLIFALYKNGLQDGDASKVKLFLQYIENYEEKTGVKVEDTRETTLLRNELNSVLTQITEPEGSNASNDEVAGSQESGSAEPINENAQA